MSTNAHTQNMQGIRFVDEFPEATIFTVNYDWSAPTDLQVLFSIGADEICSFDLSLFLLNRALFPDGYNLRAFLPFTTGSTQINEFKPTSEGDFESGFVAGVLFNFCVDGVEYDIWLPREDLFTFLSTIPHAEAESRLFEQS